MRYRVLPYRQGSAGAKALADALGGKVLKLEGSTFKPRPGDVVINWGNADYPDFLYSMNFNMVPLRSVTNKLNFFNLMKAQADDVIPRFWTSADDIPEDAYPVVCRTVLAGHSGAGIVVADTPDGVVEAPLYVEYKKKKDEYRVHCGKRSDESVVIATQRKARRLDCEEPNWQIRNHSNGFVYVRNDVNPPASVTEAALRAFEATGLDFGAVDVIYNEHEGKAYVLEINTAPGLEGQTVEDYANFFKGL